MHIKLLMEANQRIYIYRIELAFRGYPNENYKTNTSFVGPEGPKAQTNNIVINFMILILTFL